MQLYLTKEEKYHLESIIAKANYSMSQIQLLQSQIQLLQRELDNVIIEFCKRNSIDVSKAKSLNIEQGFIEFEDDVKNNKNKKIKSS